MNEQVVLIAIGLVVAVFVLRPLLRGKGSRMAKHDVAVSPRGSVSDELAELELDREMGRVSEADYARWRSELETTPPDQNTPAATTVPDNDTEVSRAEALVRRWREAPRPTCPTCGVRPEPEARYCSNCGAALSP